MSLIKLIKKQLLHKTDESRSTFANLSFNSRKRGGEIKGDKSRGEEHLNIERLTFFESEKRQ